MKILVIFCNWDFVEVLDNWFAGDDDRLILSSLFTVNIVTFIGVHLSNCQSLLLLSFILLLL